MNEEQVLTLATDAVKTMIMLSGPILGVALVIGILVSIFQAVTQINEATLSFIPKVLGIILVMAILAPWMLKVMQDYTIQMLGNTHEWIR